MEFEELRQRLEQARTLAVLKRLEAVEVLAQNVDLRHENGSAFTREHVRKLGEDGQVGMQPDPIKAPDAER